MPKFALAFIGFTDNELKIHFVEAPDEITAAKQFLLKENWEAEGEAFPDMKAVKCFCFDCDCMIDVVPLPAPPDPTLGFAPPSRTVEGN